MSQRSSSGWRKVWKPLLIVGLLVAGILYRKKLIAGPNDVASVTNVPPDFRDAVTDVLGGSEYSGSLNNWLAIAKMETAGFTSNLWLKANNPWGMQQPIKRETTSIGPYVSLGMQPAFNWAKYSTYQDAARDILYWMRYTNFPKGHLSISDFVDALQNRNYDDNPNYYNLVIAWMNK